MSAGTFRMLSRIIVLILAATLAFGAANKKITGTARGENQDLILHVTIYADADGTIHVHDIELRMDANST